MGIDTRAKLLEATRSLIDREGLGSVTLRAVGAEAGLSRGAAYRHFRDKEGLLAAITDENFERLLESYEGLSRSELAPRAIVRELLLRFHAFGLASSVHYQLMFATHWDVERFPALHRNAERVFERAGGLLSRLLDSSGVDGSLALSRTAIAYAFIHGLVELHLAGHFESLKGLGDTEELVDELIDLISAK